MSWDYLRSHKDMENEMTQLTWLSSHVFSGQSVFIKPNTLNWNCRTFS